jgi:hypothetical protein
VAVRAVSTFGDFVTETSNVRDVSTRLLLLEVDRTPLYVLTNNSKRKVSVYSPRIEWFEDADLVLTTTMNGTAAVGAAGTTINVTDGTLFGINDMLSFAGTTASASDPGEIALVTGVATNILTIQRGFASTTADTVGTTATIKILGVAAQEASAIQTPRTPQKAQKLSGAQIFEWPMQITRTAASTKIYGDRPERARLQMLAMRRQKLEIENIGLFGKYSESLSGTSSRYTSMGLRSIISSFNTDAGGTLTMGTFMQWSRFAFRFGSPEKLLVASPLIKEAMDFWAVNKILTKSEDKVFGISLRRYVTSNGTWLIANNYNMDGSAADEAYGVDLPSVEFCPLNENGINNDTQLILDYDKTNPKLIKDLCFTQAGWRFWHQARHARLYDAITYS